MERGHVFFFPRKILLKCHPRKFRGIGLDVPGDQRKTLADPEKGSKAASWSRRFNCGSRFVSTARCCRVDPIRRLDLRLVCFKTNLRRAKTRYSE